MFATGHGCDTFWVRGSKSSPSPPNADLCVLAQASRPMLLSLRIAHRISQPVAPRKQLSLLSCQQTRLLLVLVLMRSCPV